MIFNWALVTQFYPRDIISKETYLLSPYGGPIYIVVDAENDLGNFNLMFHDVLEYPRFILGQTKNEDWVTTLKESKAPMAELEVPGIIWYMRRSVIDDMKPDMQKVAEKWKTIMETYAEFQGYTNDIPHRYVFDVQINPDASGHAGYTLMEAIGSGDAYVFDMNGDLGKGWLTVPYHEIGHDSQDSRWTPRGFAEIGVALFSGYLKNTIARRLTHRERKPHFC